MEMTRSRMRSATPAGSGANGIAVGDWTWLWRRRLLLVVGQPCDRPSKLLGHLDGAFHLRIPALFEGVAREFDYMVRLDALSFQQRSFPRQISGGRESQHKAVTNFE